MVPDKIQNLKKQNLSFEISSGIKFQVNIVYRSCSKKKLLSYQVLQYFIKILFAGINRLKLPLEKEPVKFVWGIFAPVNSSLFEGLKCSGFQTLLIRA